MQVFDVSPPSRASTGELISIATAEALRQRSTALFQLTRNLFFFLAVIQDHRDFLPDTSRRDFVDELPARLPALGRLLKDHFAVFVLTREVCSTKEFSGQAHASRMSVVEQYWQCRVTTSRLSIGSVDEQSRQLFALMYVLYFKPFFTSLLAITTAHLERLRVQFSSTSSQQSSTRPFPHSLLQSTKMTSSCVT